MYTVQQMMKATTVAVATAGAGVSANAVPANSVLAKGMLRGRELSIQNLKKQKVSDETVTATTTPAPMANEMTNEMKLLLELTPKLNDFCANQQQKQAAAAVSSSSDPTSVAISGAEALFWDVGADDDCAADGLGQDFKPDAAQHGKCCKEVDTQAVEEFVAKTAEENKQHGCDTEKGFMWIADASLPKGGECQSTAAVLSSMGINSDDWFGPDGTGADGNAAGGEGKKDENVDEKAASKNSADVEWVLPAFAAGALALLAVFGLFVHRRRTSAESATSTEESGSAAHKVEASKKVVVDQKSSKQAKKTPEDKLRLASVTSSGLNGGGAEGSNKSGSNKSGRKIYGGRSNSSPRNGSGASAAQRGADCEQRMEAV